jgi:hypothetical protein
MPGIPVRRAPSTTLSEPGWSSSPADWRHVDVEDHLGSFYSGSRGFTPAGAGLIPLAGA